MKDLNQDLASSGSGTSSSSGSSSVWEALLHIVGAINYGGRVTDPDDRRLLAAIVQRHLSPEVLAGNALLGRPGELYLEKRGRCCSHQLMSFVCKLQYVSVRLAPQTNVEMS